ncbi:unnamed protein product [Polarella glacialis]|nr:unnamed protein product [Polarella glacialis]
MVYIHGGSLVQGSGDTDFSNFMRHGCTDGCVVVVIQYRLDVLGWLANRALSQEQGGSSGNYGLLDQQMALQWVRRNIHDFAGDPDRVTVAGQSSGGTSIFALLASPASRGLFYAAISLSGSPNVSMDLSTAEVQNAGITAGCRGTGEELLSCLRNASVESLLAAKPACWSNPMQDILPTDGFQWHGRGSQCGLVIVDGRVVQQSSVQALSNGLVDVAFIVGNMGWESGTPQPMSQEQWSTHLSHAFAIFGEGVGHQVDVEFSDDAAVSSVKANRAVTTSYGLTCAAKHLARAALTGNYSSPIYVYVNNWSPAAFAPEWGPENQWAFHSWDLTVALEGWPANYTPGEGDLAHARFLQKSWYDLMKHGALSPADHAGWLPVNSDPGWPSVLATMVLADPADGGPGPSMISSYKAAICELFESVGIGQSYWWTN